MRHCLYPIVAAGIALGIGFSAKAADGNATPEDRAAGLANPAAVFCVEQGGRFEIRDADAGSQGFCILPDGTEVDAWTYFREQSQSEVR